MVDGTPRETFETNEQEFHIITARAQHPLPSLFSVLSVERVGPDRIAVVPAARYRQVALESQATNLRKKVRS